MSLYLDTIKEKAQKWKNNEKQSKYLLSRYGFMAAYCWSFKNKQRCSDLAREFIEQSYIAQGGSAGWAGIHF